MVIIVDATTDPQKADLIEKACQEHGAVYLRVKPGIQDTRCLQFNLGISAATTEWILIQGDDDDIIVEFDHEAFDSVAAGVDYLWNGVGTNIFYHRRANYLRLGGYPEDMIVGEDIVFSHLARATSRGGLEGSLYRKVEPARERWEMRATTLHRAVAAFWYSFGILRYIERTPSAVRKNALMLFPLSLVRLWRDRAYRPVAILGLIASFIGATVGLGWHFFRKVADSDFRGSIRFYRSVWGDPTRSHRGKSR